MPRSRHAASKSGGAGSRWKWARTAAVSQAKTLRPARRAVLDDTQQALDEPAAGGRLRAEGQLPPDDRVPQGALGGVVGRLHALNFGEGPEVFAVLPQFLAEAMRQPIEVAAQEQPFHLLTDRLHAADERAAGERSVRRLTADAVTTLGSGVDGAVRRIEIAYDGQGNAYLVTSYDAASGGNVVNQVQREFNGLGQLTKEWQAHS